MLWDDSVDSEKTVTDFWWDVARRGSVGCGIDCHERSYRSGLNTGRGESWTLFAPGSDAIFFNQIDSYYLSDFFILYQVDSVVVLVVLVVGPSGVVMVMFLLKDLIEEGFVLYRAALMFFSHQYQYVESHF